MFAISDAGFVRHKLEVQLAWRIEDQKRWRRWALGCSRDIVGGCSDFLPEDGNRMKQMDIGKANV